MVKRITCLLFMLMAMMQLNIQAQKKYDRPQTGFGGGLVYNFPVSSFGGEVKVKIPVSGKFFAVPEVSYFVPFSPIHELYIGAALHYEIIEIGKFTPYLAAGAYYNNWINIAEYRSDLKERNNLAPEIGGGIVLNRGCVRPYLESRYDIKWKEGTIRLGILIYPGACKGRRKKVSCPAYG